MFEKIQKNAFYQILTISMACFAFFMFFSMPLFADEPLSYQQALTQIIELFKSAETRGIGLALLIVQILMIALKTPLQNLIFNKIGDKYKLVAVSILSFVAMVLSNLVLGQSFSDLMANAGIVNAFSVMLHQIFKQFVVKKEDPNTITIK